MVMRGAQVLLLPHGRRLRLSLALGKAHVKPYNAQIVQRSVGIRRHANGRSSAADLLAKKNGEATSKIERTTATAAATKGTRAKSESAASTSSTSAASKSAEEKPAEEASDLLKAFGIGSAAGALGSLVGMGGGFVMIPLMTSLLRLSQHQAHGTSLFAVTTTGIAGAVGYSSGDLVRWESAAALAAGGMITARLGAQATAYLSGPTLKKALGVFMICVAPLIPGKAYLMDRNEKSRRDELETEGSDNDNLSLPRRLLAPAMIGLSSGFLSGLFGVGGGTVVVPALSVATDMTHHEALATSLCAMVAPAVVGTLTHFRQSNVAMRVAPMLAAGAFAGAYCGSKLGQRTNEGVLRWGFSFLMVVLGTRTLMKV